MAQMIFVVVALLGFKPAAAAETQTLTFAHGALAADLAWERGPLVGKESLLHVQWHMANGQPTEPGGTFEVVLDMPMMGHGSVPTEVHTAGKPGEYRIGNVYFLMGGDWNVMVTLHPATGDEETQTLPVHLNEN